MASPGLKPTPRWLEALEWNRQTLVRGQTLFRCGELPIHAFILESGLVKLSRENDSHTDSFVQIIYPGHLFGGPAASSGKFVEPRLQASCLASATVYSMPCDRLFEACREFSDLWQWLLNQMSARVDRIEFRMHQLTYWRVEDRIVWLLVDISAALDDGSDRIDVPLAQYEIAQLVAATRETVSTILNHLQRKGVVELGRRYVRVLSVPALRKQLTAAGTL